MPHSNHNNTSTQSQQQSQQNAGGSPGDDLGSTDEVKVFKDEGDREDEKISSENLLVEEKSSLIDLTESEEKSGKSSSRQDHSPVYGKLDTHSSHSFNMGYLVSPYSYPNGTAAVSMANKMGLSPFFCHNGDHLTTPPPAHCGIPSYQLDPKTIGLTRPAIYPFATTQYPYPMLSPEMTQVASWHTPSMYSPASGFRSPYPSSLPINTSIPSDFYRFSPTSLLPSVHPAAAAAHHVLNSHPAIVTPGPKQDILGQDSNHRYIRSTLDQKQTSSSLHHQPHHNQQQDFHHHAHHPHLNSQKDNNSSINSNNSNDSKNKKPHIKKPLNAFMLYMKEMRAKVVAECTLKESAAINQILGRKWHSLSREEQSIYYEKARQERQMHMELYPGWSARDNYGYGSKKKKRKKDRSPADSGGNNMKKCRARYGLDQQNQWCKPCRRKKKCIRYKEAENDDGSSRHDGSGGGSGRELENHVSDDNLGSCGSVGDAQTPEDDNESLNQSMSSPGCLSGLSSLQSPSTSLASPLNLLASPSTPQTMHQHHDGIGGGGGGGMGGSGSGGGSMSGGVGGLGLTTLIDLNNAIPTLNNYQKTMKNHFNNNNINNSSQYNSKQQQQQQQQLSQPPPPHQQHNNNNSSSNINNNNHNNAMSTTLDSSNHVINNSSVNNSSSLINHQRNSNSSSNSGSSSNHEKKQNGGLDRRRLSISVGSPKSSTTTSSATTPSTEDLLKVEIKREPNTMESPQHQNRNNLPPPPPLVPLPPDGLGNSIFDKIAAVRNPVGANPRDVNNPLNINQLTKRNFTNHPYHPLANPLLSGGAPHPDASFYQLYHSMMGGGQGGGAGGMMSPPQQQPSTTGTSSAATSASDNQSIFVSSFSPAATHRHHQILSQRHLQLQQLQQQQQNLAAFNLNPHSLPPGANQLNSNAAANSHHNFNLALAAQLTAAAAAQHHFPHMSPVNAGAGHSNSNSQASAANGLMFGASGSHHHSLMTALHQQQQQQLQQAAAAAAANKQAQQSQASPLPPTSSSSSTATSQRHSGEDGISVT